MKTNEVNNNARETVKESYVKPAVEVYEMELEGGVLTGASADDMGDNGGVGRPQSTSSGFPWDKYSTHHEL